MEREREKRDIAHAWLPKEEEGGGEIPKDNRSGATVGNDVRPANVYKAHHPCVFLDGA